MFKNYFITAARFIKSNWRHVIINILGLSTGLFVFFLATSLQEHERKHDDFFTGSENIYGIYTRVLPTAGFGTSRVFGIPPVIGPLVAENINGIEASSRYLERRQPLRVDEFSSYESVKFVDPEFIDIFDFEFLDGSPEDSLQSGSSLIMTREAAMRYFGRVDAVGESILLGGRLELAVMGVIEDLPANSHFVYRFGTAERLQVIAPIAALENLGETELLSNWGSVSDRYRLWLKLAPEANPDQLVAEISSFLAGHFDETGERVIAGFSYMKLTDWNFNALDANGISLISVAVALSALVLLVAALNYSNLFTAMVARRLHELAVRKTLGATRFQLSVQIFIESLLLTSIAALFSFAAAGAVLPALGAVVGKDIEFANLVGVDLVMTVITVTVVTAILSVAYPVYVVSRLATARTLRGQAFRGRTGARLRSSLVVVQFTFNAILGTLMVITLLQNQHLLRSDPGFDSDNVIIVSGVSNPLVQDRLDTLVNSLRNVPGIVSIAGSSQHPYQELHNQGGFTTEPGGTTNSIYLYRFSVGEDFFSLYGIDSIGGRTLNRVTNNDTIRAQNASSVTNVVVNQQALATLGITGASEAIDQVFYSLEQDQARQTFRIVGVVEDANLLGLANDIKSSVFRLEPGSFTNLSVRVDASASSAILSDINAAWGELFPEIPAESAFLQETFRSRFEVLAGINRVLIALSIVSILLAIFGLYGLISVLAQQRKHEIAIRKVLGATVANLLKLLSWQFTKPVGLALIIGAPIGMLAGGQYLNQFADRIESASLVAVGVAISIMLLAWLIISGQILSAVRKNPTEDLRRE